jgi:hypothetical protein
VFVITLTSGFYSGAVADVDRTVLAHPGFSYLIVAFMVLCTTALQETPIALLLYLIPVAAAFYVARTATIVDATGLTARGVFGSETVRWDELIGLELANSGAVYAVAAGGSKLKLPCVRSTKVTRLIMASGGRIPNPAAA